MARRMLAPPERHHCAWCGREKVTYLRRTRAGGWVIICPACPEVSDLPGVTASDEAHNIWRHGHGKGFRGWEL